MSKTKILYKDIAPGAAEGATFESNSASDFSDINLLRKETEALNVATGELNEWILNGNTKIYRDEKVPFWSKTLSDEGCNFETPPPIEINLFAQYASVGLTLIFNTATGAYCSDINIKWYLQDSLQADIDFKPTKPIYFCQHNVDVFDRIVITLLKTSLPLKYAKLQQVVFGVYREFEMDEIRSAKITNQLNSVSLDVPVSTLNWTLDSHDDVDYMFQLKQPVEAWNDDLLLGVYYITRHQRLSKNLYDLECEDAIGVLDGSTFAGGLYNNYSAKQLLRDIVGDLFDIDFGDVEDRNLTGIIYPDITRREACQQVLFAWGVCAATDGSYMIRVFMLDDEVAEIGEDRTYAGPRVETSDLVTAVQITAHTYKRDSYGGVEIDGLRYSDTTTVYEIKNPNVTVVDKQNVKSVTGATLISPDIGQETAERIYNYYTRRNTASAKIVWRGERLGDCVTVPNAWGGTETGNIEKMDIILSNTVAAECEIIS